MPTPVTIAGAVDVLTPVTAGMLSQSGLINFSSQVPLTPTPQHKAWHTDTSVPGAWLQVDLGAGNARSDQNVANVPASQHMLESTMLSSRTMRSRGGNPLLISRLPQPVLWSKIAVGRTVGPHRYWRILLNNTPGGLDPT
jgi:hypothetical protein